MLDDQRSASHGSWAKSGLLSVFVNSHGDTAMLLCLHIIYAAFLPQWQNLVVLTVNTCPTRPKICPSLTFYRKSLLICSLAAFCLARSWYIYPMDCSPPGSSVHGILQARILEWVAILVCRETSWPRDWAHISRIAGGIFIIWATWEVPLQWKWSTITIVIFKLVIKFLKKFTKRSRERKKWTQFTCHQAIMMDIKGCICPPVAHQ